MVDQERGVPEDTGVEWQGSPESLEQWKAYKQAKAVRFVQHGYAVEWSPDASNSMMVYSPRRHATGQREIRAGVLFFAEPSKFGIDGGRISKLHIGVGAFSRQTLYNYDRGLDVDRLSENPAAQALFDIVLAELN
jgi:hypothetical protein